MATLIRQHHSLSVTPLLHGRVAFWVDLNANRVQMLIGDAYMFKGSSGKLMVYTPTGLPSNNRLDSVRDAAKETAKRLNLDFEVVRFERQSTPIYVYYEEDEGEPIPLYCDEGKIVGYEEISSALRHMMFVLSFHPKHRGLASMRSELLKLS